jgi:hypothetical protein
MRPFNRLVVCLQTCGRPTGWVRAASSSSGHDAAHTALLRSFVPPELLRSPPRFDAAAREALSDIAEERGAHVAELRGDEATLRLAAERVMLEADAGRDVGLLRREAGEPSVASGARAPPGAGPAVPQSLEEMAGRSSATGMEAGV